LDGEGRSGRSRSKGEISIDLNGVPEGADEIEEVLGDEEIAIVALGIEVFVVPGFGIAGAISILCIGGAVFLALIGNLPIWKDVVQAASILSMASLLVIAAVYTLVRQLPSRAGGIFLMASADRATGYVAAPVRVDLVGMEGVAHTDLHPAGTAILGSERLDVVSEGGFINRGDRVRVVRSEGYRHIVEPV